MRVENRVRLVITGFDSDPEEISRILRVRSTKAWRRGDTDPKSLRVRKENGWMSRSPVDPHAASSDEAVSALLNSFPDLALFGNLPHGCYVQITCTIYTYDVRPFLYLRADTIAQIAKCAAHLDVDVYDLSEDVAAETPAS